MNKIRENMNRFITCTAYRDGKPVTSWAKCVRMDGTHYWKTVEGENSPGLNSHQRISPAFSKCLRALAAGSISTTIQRREAAL